jgi:N-acetylglucosaminyl-diphospho-decaprenol L-rhamnosyltransferase
MTQAGAIIVTYNSGAEIGPCLDAAIPRASEIVVVDNGSTDNTLEEVRKRPSVKLISNSLNRGFAGAVNQGFGATESPYVLLLNPDAILLTGVEPMAAACARPGIGAAGGKLLDANGRLQSGFMVRRFPTALTLILEVLGVNRLWKTNPVNRRYRCLEMDPDAPGEVEQPAGAFLMIRRDAWQAAGGFDEEFHPLWFEDVDFLKRLRDKGLRAVYEPSATARHQGGHSARRLAPEPRTLYWYASLLRYCSKHFTPSRLAAVCIATVLGSVLRMIGESVVSRKLGPLRVYSKVVRLACVRLMLCRFAGAGSSPVLARH